MGKAIRVGTTVDYPPLTQLDGERVTGLDVELVRAYAETEGAGILFAKTTWKGLGEGLNNGEFVVAAGGINSTPDRRDHFAISAPLLICAKVPLVREAEVVKFPNFGAIDSPGVRVVTNPGGTNQRFSARFKKATVIVAKDNKEPFEMLAAGTADVMITDSIEALHRQRVTKGSSNPLAALRPQTPLTDGFTVILGRRGTAGQQFVEGFSDWLQSPGGRKVKNDLMMRFLGTTAADASLSARL
eukprot:Hpha_TRINITY_DN11116_c0_g1::TRINITY_DN11116_c0_g1_i1::g.28171::m.28171/K01713/pheC; cyclohexadienyl dehydratase